MYEWKYKVSKHCKQVWEDERERERERERSCENDRDWERFSFLLLAGMVETQIEKGGKNKLSPAGNLTPASCVTGGATCHYTMGMKIFLRKKNKLSPAGNWTPVSRVTGGDTNHYTTEELCMCSEIKILYILLLFSCGKMLEFLYFPVSQFISNLFFPVTILSRFGIDNTNSSMPSERPRFHIRRQSSLAKSHFCPIWQQRPHHLLRQQQQTNRDSCQPRDS